MFKDNLKQILQNLPLTLSDTYDPKDVSLNRVIILLFAIAIMLAGLIVLIWYRAEALQLVGYWQAIIAAFTTMVTGNMAKTVFKNKGGI